MGLTLSSTNLVYASAATVPGDSVLNKSVLLKPASPLAILSKLSPKQIQAKLGRKLTLKEKVGLQLLRWKIAKIPPDEKVSTKDGRTAQTLGILALVAILVFPLATIPLGIIAITKGSKALKENPNDGQAQAGKIMGIISLALLALVILLILAFISSLFVY